MNNKTRSLLAVVTAAITMLIISCSDDNFIIGNTFFNSGTYAEYVNTTELELATFKLDSVETSGTNHVWVGNVKYPVIGEIHSKSLVKLSQPSFYDWRDKERYDSCTIVLRHSGMYQGDTIEPITIYIRRLAQPLRFAEKESSFFNVRQFSAGDTIGKIRVRPKPHGRPRLRYKIADSFGQELVTFIKENKATPNNIRQEKFERLLGGIQIEAGEGAKSMESFIADSVTITLHSHLRGLSDVKRQRMLTITEKEKQYNVIWNDKIDEPYDKLDQRYKQVTEAEGDLHSVLFEGLGYYTRINFPTTLQEVVDKNYDKHVVKATLRIYPERDAYDKHNFPNTFYLSRINKGNVQGSTITNGQSPVRAILHNNLLDENDVYYTCDLTYYINTLLSQGEIDRNEGIMLSWSPYFDANNYNFMVFNGRKKKRFYTYLELYYYDYDKAHR